MLLADFLEQTLESLAVLYFVGFFVIESKQSFWQVTNLLSRASANLIE